MNDFTKSLLKLCCSPVVCWIYLLLLFCFFAYMTHLTQSDGCSSESWWVCLFCRMLKCILICLSFFCYVEVYFDLSVLFLWILFCCCCWYFPCVFFCNYLIILYLFQQSINTKSYKALAILGKIITKTVKKRNCGQKTHRLFRSGVGMLLYLIKLGLKTQYG